MAQRFYTDLTPTFADRTQWALPTVLRHYAQTTPDAIYLDCPEENATWTYAAVLREAELVGRSLLAAGAVKGDRVVIMGANSSRFIRTWLGTAVSGTVEVPINTAYEHDFLAHQVRTVAARFAVIDDVHAAKFLAVAEAASTIEKFWIIDTGSAPQPPRACAPTAGRSPTGTTCSPSTPPATCPRSVTATSPRCSSPPAPPARPRASRCRTPRCTSSVMNVSR